MSRGGRRGGGSRKVGPATEDWDDDPEDRKKWIPERTFPPIQRVVPPPLSQSERSRVAYYRRFREALRDGPLYTVLESDTLTDEKGRVNKRAGYNPFESMPTYSETKYKKKKRTLPDLSYRSYVLKYFPQELWSTIDPKRKAPEWQFPEFQTQNGAAAGFGLSTGKRTLDEDNKDEDDEDEDIKLAGRKKQRRKQQRDDPTNPGQKKGLEAEDEYGPDPDQADNPEDDAADDAENVDTDFSESEDGAGDDYDAEQYFDTGEQDDYDEGGENDDGGVF